MNGKHIRNVGNKTTVTSIGRETEEKKESAAGNGPFVKVQF